MTRERQKGPRLRAFRVAPRHKMREHFRFHAEAKAPPRRSASLGDSVWRVSVGTDELGVRRGLDTLGCGEVALEGFVRGLVAADDHVLAGHELFVAEPRDLCP